MPTTTNNISKEIRWRTAGRWFAFFYSILALAGLIILAIAYSHKGLKDILSTNIPSAVLSASWAGALGGIAISFKGVFDHKAKLEPGDDPSKTKLWSNELMPWHIGRPFTGLIVGIFVFIALKAVYPSGNPSEVTLAAVSFVLGTQEHNFFLFIKEIGAVVVNVPKNNNPTDPSLKNKKL